MPVTAAPLQIEPGHRLGAFCLGMPLGAATEYLRRNPITYPHVDLVYDSQKTRSSDIVIRLEVVGLVLRFEPVLQRLTTLCVEEPSRVLLEYQGEQLNKEIPDLPSLDQVLRLFGPSSGTYDNARHEFKLHYPGLTFFFPIAAEQEGLLPVGMEDLIQHGRFPDGTVPRIQRLLLHTATHLESSALTARAAAMSLPSWRKQPTYGEAVEVLSGAGLYFSQRKRMMPFGATPQDILSSFGPPADVYFKAKGQDKMRIHSSRDETAGSTDYIFNYFELGVDAVFDGESHTTTKFVMHANQLGHYDFDQYYQCNFVLVAGCSQRNRSSSCGSAETGQSLGSSVVSAQPKGLVSPTSKEPVGPSKGKGKGKRKATGEGGGSSLPRVNSMELQSVNLGTEENEASFVDSEHGDSGSNSVPVDIGPMTPWSVVSRAYPGEFKQPVAFKREPGVNTVDPYGSMQLRGARNIIFEVMPNDLISTVTLFKLP